LTLDGSSPAGQDQVTRHVGEQGFGFRIAQDRTARQPAARPAHSNAQIAIIRAASSFKLWFQPGPVLRIATRFAGQTALLREAGPGRKAMNRP
jgi:hypothetical protein